MWLVGGTASRLIHPCVWRDILGGDALSWLNLQGAYDLRVAEINNAKRIAREDSPAAA